MGEAGTGNGEQPDGVQFGSVEFTDPVEVERIRKMMGVHGINPDQSGDLEAFEGGEPSPN
jgi:hypothetical protein